MVADSDQAELGGQDWGEGWLQRTLGFLLHLATHATNEDPMDEAPSQLGHARGVALHQRGLDLYL